MIHITKISKGSVVFRKIGISQGLNKLDENADTADFLNLPFIKEKIESGDLVIKANTLALDADPDSEKKSGKNKKGKNAVDVNI